jgi:hypothetical protein
MIGCVRWADHPCFWLLGVEFKGSFGYIVVSFYSVPPRLNSVTFHYLLDSLGYAAVNQSQGATLVPESRATYINFATVILGLESWFLIYTTWLS